MSSRDATRPVQPVARHENVWPQGGEGGGVIPGNVRGNTLVQNYVEAADILSREDRRLLQSQIVPLFAQAGAYRHELLIDDIEQHGETTLRNAVSANRCLAMGQRRNQSFENLVDAGILTLQGRPHSRANHVRVRPLL